MATPLEKTFDLLAKTTNASAIGLLVTALDVADESVQALAVGALLERGPSHGIVEIIRRVHFLTRPARDLIAKEAPRLSRGLRDALISGDATLKANALELVRKFEDYGELPTLTRLLEEQALRERDGIESALFDLVNRLYEHMQFGTDRDESAGFLRDVQRIRHQMLATLESSCHRFHVHRCRRVIEGLLVLSDPENIYLKKLFQECSDEVRGAAADLLYSSTHPGVLNLIVASLAENYPLPAIFSTFERRTDPEFICHLLRHWPHKLTAFQQKNLKELRAVKWLEPGQNHLHLVPAALHCSMIAFLMATGLSPSQKLAVLEWMVRCGSPEGRLAATDVLKELEDDRVQDVVLESLDSKVPDVQAWATSQLRAWSIPNAMEMLVERLDSPMPEVRQAARDELAGFDVHRALEIFEHLEPHMQTAVGRLVRKIDPHTAQKLKGEMLTAIRSKRIRAARAALAMNLQFEVADALVVMARDTDNLVRRTAAEVLGKVHSREAIEMLLELTNDGSPRVRETAASALDQIRAARDPSSNPNRDVQREPAPSLEARPMINAPTINGIGRVCLPSASSLGLILDWDWRTLLPHLIAIAVAGTLLWLAANRMEWFRHFHRQYSQSQAALFAELCQTHELSRAERTLLSTIAQAGGDSELCCVFVNPRVIRQFARHNPADASNCQELCQRLFGEHVAH